MFKSKEIWRQVIHHWGVHNVLSSFCTQQSSFCSTLPSRNATCSPFGKLASDYFVERRLKYQGAKDALELWSPTFLAPEISFKEDNFSTDQGGGGWLGDDSGALHSLCTLFLLLLHQLHLRPLGIRPRGWETPPLNAGIFPTDHNLLEYFQEQRTHFLKTKVCLLVKLTPLSWLSGAPWECREPAERSFRLT